jgi:putative peptidoglycan lipid II flippase
MLALVLIVLNALAMLAMPYLVWAMASGFVGDERFDLTVLFGRIAFPYILFISLAALISGVLNSAGRFVAAAAAPVLLNICFILALFTAQRLGWDIGLTLVWSVPVAGIAQLAALWIAAHRAGFKVLPRWPKMTPELKRLAMIAAPAALAGGVVQVNLLVGRQIASYFEGANAWLYYADRLYQLPLGVVGVAIGIVLLPDLSRRLRIGDEAGGQAAFNRAAELALLLTIPCTVALIVTPSALVSVLFERGAFLASDTQATALATAIYGLGLPAFVLQKLYQPVYFAREDTRSPFNFALVALAVNALVAIGLSRYIGFTASAYGATCAGWAMLGCLWWRARRFGPAARWDAQLRNRSLRILLASLGMGVIVWITARAVEPVLQMEGLRLLGLIVILLVAGGSYIIAGRLLGAFSLAQLRQMMRQAD